MIREQKNKFWSILILILSLSFSAVALTAAAIFKNEKNKSVLPAVAADESSDSFVSTGWKKNSEATLVQEIGTIYGGSTISVEETGDLNTVENDESWHSTLRIKITHDSYGVNTFQPYIKNGYRLTGFYFEGGGVKYANTDANDVNKTLFQAGESATSEQIDPSYTGKIKIIAHCEPIEYKAYLYYSTDGENWNEVEQKFTVEGSPLTNSITIPTGSNVTKFGGWALKADADNLDTSNDDYINIGNIQFTHEGAKPEYKESGDGFKYYFVDKIKGYSSSEDNFKADLTKDYQQVKPTIRATWSYIYDGLLFNTATNSINSSKVGEFAKGEKFTNSTDASDERNGHYNLKFAQNSSYAFFSNTGSAFKTDKFSGEYAFYNYGHEINGYEIYFSYGTENTNGVVYNGSAWSVGDSTLTTIGTLSSTKMGDLAKELDAFFVGGYPAGTSIYLKPTWSNVKINVIANGTTISSEILYGGNYSVSDNGIKTTYAGQGKTVYYYTTGNGNVIAKNHSTSTLIPWNYVNIPETDFEYNATNAVYNLAVTPYAVDNIYKINLLGDESYGNRLYNSVSSGSYTYKLQTETNGYAFANIDSNASANILTISNIKLKNGTTYTSLHTEYAAGRHLVNGVNSVEKYVTDSVVAAKTKFESSANPMASDYFYFLRKVYAQGATGGNEFVSSNGAENFFIYLVNNRPSADLPVFVRDYYSLIAWDIKDGKQNISYTTTTYQKATDKTDLNEDLKPNSIYNSNTSVKGYWQYVDHYNNGSDFNLQAHYFRKNYLLDLNTLREGKTGASAEGRFGYIYIEVEDNQASGSETLMEGKYFAIYKDGKMNLYSVQSGESFDEISLLFVGDIITSDEGIIKFVENVPYIKLYAGCDVNLKASCVDGLRNNANDYEYQDMVGYYLSSITTNSGVDSSNNPRPTVFNNVEYSSISDKALGKHVVNISKDNANLKMYPNGTIITINANFAPIDYKFEISLKTAGNVNKFAGYIESKGNTSVSNGTITLTGNIENFKDVIVRYSAIAGYTLADAAFTTTDLGNNIITLQAYDNSADAEDEAKKQSYVFSLSGKWLLDNYYTYTYNATIDDASTSDVYEGQILDIDVNTQVYTFNYVVKIQGDTGLLEERVYANAVVLNGAIDAENYALISRGSEYSVISKELIAKEFVKLDNFYIITVLNCEKEHEHTTSCSYKKYAIISSYLPQITDSANYTLNYDFLLKDDEINSHVGEKLVQARLNHIFGRDLIVEHNQRNLEIQINVKELYTVTMQSAQHVKADPKYGDRITTITNSANNSESLVTNGGDFSKTQVVYTYKGLRNDLTSSYDTKRYMGVTYSLAGVELDVKHFILDGTTVDEVTGNINLIITYIPKPITVFEISYYLNNSLVEYDDVKSIIEEKQKPNSVVELYTNDVIYYEYALKSTEYVVTIKFEGRVVNATRIACKVTQDSFEDEKLDLEIRIDKLDQSKLYLIYSLADHNKATPTDNYGSFKVFEVNNSTGSKFEKELQQDLNGFYYTSIVVGRKVEVDISDLSVGYNFVKLTKNNELVTDEVTDNVIVVTEEFDKTISNVYVLVIDKVNVKAKLTAFGSYRDQYKMFVDNEEVDMYNGVAKADTYIGSTLSFAKVDTEREALGNYYYSYINDAGETIKENILPTGEQISLTITSELINLLKNHKTDEGYVLNIGVDRLAKYNLKYTIINQGYVENAKIMFNGLEYVSGTNVINGGKLNLEVVTKDNIMDGFNIKEAKYDIKLEGCIEEIVLTGKTEKEITVDADKELIITITPKQYNSTYNEYIYTELEKYKALDRGEALDDENKIGDVSVLNNLLYGSNAVMTVNRLSSGKGELSVIRLFGNDLENVIVHLAGKQIVSIYDVTNNVEYVADSVNAKHITGDNPADVQIVSNLIEKLKTFGYSLSFVEERVSIAYVVKNTIDISVEYLSYKTLTPLI